MSEATSELAAKIAEDLFTNGVNEKADRLVLTSEDGRDLGGWSKSAATQRIHDLLEEAREGDF